MSRCIRRTPHPERPSPHPSSRSETLRGRRLSRFQQGLLDIHSELVSYTPPDPRIIGNLLENCLLHLTRARERPGIAARVPENLLAVRRFIGTAPATPVTLPQLADMAGISIPHFSAIFRKTFGLPPMECLIRHRLHLAALLLDDHNLTISEIAREGGLRRHRSLFENVQKHFGASPRDVRKRNPEASRVAPGESVRCSFCRNTKTCKIY